MGYIREPEGVDLVIKSRHLTAEEEKAISEFIQADKVKRQSRLTPKPEESEEKIIHLKKL